MRVPRESGGVDCRLDACPRQRRQRGAGRQVAASVVRAGRLAGGDCDAANVDTPPPSPMSVEIAAGRRQPRRPCRPRAAQRRHVATIRRHRDEPRAGAGAVRRRCAAARSGSRRRTVVDAERYMSGFHAATFFYPGPAGYDAAFAIRTSEVPELSDIKFADPIEVQISGSALLYDLDAPIAIEGQPVASPRRRVSRHPPDDPRASSALHVRALRRALCRVGDLLRRRRLALQDADLQGRRSGRAALPACAARGRRHAAEPPRRKAAADRAARRGCRNRSATTGRANFCPAPVFAARAAAPTTRSIRRSVFRSPTRRPSPIRRSTSAATGRSRRIRRCARRRLRPGATISANAAASRSANVPPASVIRARTSARDRASRRPAWSVARIMAISSRFATASSCARHGRRRPICSSTRRTSTSGFATCT